MRKRLKRICALEECNVEFEVTRKDKIYCSPQCRNKASKKRNSYSTTAEYFREYRKKNPKIKQEISRRYHLKSKFGISEKEYNTLSEKQEEKCKICRNRESIKDRRLTIDHCHKTGKIRGLLCFKCNRALGGFNDDVELLSNAITYLSAA